jgi:hypothetical protein
MEIGKMKTFTGLPGQQVWVNFSYKPAYVCFNFDEGGVLRVRMFEPQAWDVYDERWR